jgi:hypothetical protein
MMFTETVPIVHYHGLADAIISSDNSPRYYNHVSRTMGLTSDQLDDFYRFFRISGMGTYNLTGRSPVNNILIRAL